jgi:hypothetical protein
MTAWNVIQHSLHAIVGLWHLISILQSGFNITALSMF